MAVVAERDDTIYLYPTCLVIYIVKLMSLKPLVALGLAFVYATGDTMVIGRSIGFFSNFIPLGLTHNVTRINLV